VRALCIAVVLLSLVLAGCAGGSSDSGSGSANSGVTTTASELRTVTIDASNGKKVNVRVEIADTEAEREKGLMYRTALGEDRGMLFVFDKEQELTFWMKNTLIPLSVAFMDSEGRIVDIQDMKPLDDDPPHYVSAEPSQYALEVNQGFFEEHGVKVGDKAKLPV
jgi:uncharacterized membrane protein (UPF0127 family)